MATKQQAIALPAAIAKLYRAIITRDDKGEIDWTTAATELVLAKFKDSPSIHTKATPTVDTNLKGIRRGQFTRLACSVRCPNEPEGSEEYVIQRDKAQRAFNTKIVDALVRMKYWQRKTRGESNSAAAKARAAAKKKALEAAKAAATAPGSIPVVSITAKVREIAERVAMAQKAVAAFQTKVTLQEDGIKRIGVIAGDLGVLATAVKEVSTMLESGKVPDKPDGAIQKALNKMRAVQNGATTAPASTTPQ